MQNGDISKEERQRLYKFEKIKETLISTIEQMKPNDENVFYLGYLLGIGAIQCKVCPAYEYCQRTTDAKKATYGNCEEIIPLFLEDPSARVKRGITEEAT